MKAEQEAHSFITTRRASLARQMESITAQKEELQRKVEAESTELIAHLQVSLKRLQEAMGRERGAAGAEAAGAATAGGGAADNGTIIATMRAEVDKLSGDQEALHAERSELIKRNAVMEEDIRRLQTENFVLNQRVAQEHEAAEARRSEATRVVSDMEADSERQFNTLSREDDRRSRARSIDGSVSPSASINSARALSELMASPMGPPQTMAGGMSRADLAEAELASRARRASSVSSATATTGSFAGVVTGVAPPLPPAEVSAIAAAAVAASSGGMSAGPVAAARGSSPGGLPLGTDIGHTRRGSGSSGGGGFPPLEKEASGPLAAGIWELRGPGEGFGNSGVSLGMPPLEATRAGPRSASVSSVSSGGSSARDGSVSDS